MHKQRRRRSIEQSVDGCVINITYDERKVGELYVNRLSSRQINRTSTLYYTTPIHRKAIVPLL